MHTFLHHHQLYDVYLLEYLTVHKGSQVYLWLSCKSPWIGANQLPKDFGYPEHEERDILYTSYLRSEALHLRVQ